MDIRNSCLDLIDIAQVACDENKELNKAKKKLNDYNSRSDYNVICQLPCHLVSLKSHSASSPSIKLIERRARCKIFKRHKAFVQMFSRYY